MGIYLWAGVLPAVMIAGWFLMRRSVRHFAEDMLVDHARQQFRLRREWLEARFVGSLAQIDAMEHLRWEDAHWHDEVLWARDRHSRALLALIGVHFNDLSYDEPGDPQPRHATALFEYQKGAWRAEGKRLDEVRPDEAVLRHQRFEPVATHVRRGY